MCRIAPHSPFDPLYLVPKPVGKVRGSELDRRGVFVVDSPSGEIFVWVGEAARPKMAEAGGRFAAQLMKYERAKGPVTVVRQGQEVARFWEVLNAEGGDEASEDGGEAGRSGAVDRDQGRSPSSRNVVRANPSANPSANPDSSWDVGTLPAYDSDFDLFTRAENGEIKTAVPGSSVLPRGASAEPPKKPEDQKQSAHSPRGEPVPKTDSAATVETDKQAAPERDQKAGEAQPPPPEKKPASGSSRKQPQPDVFVPSVSRAYPVSTLPPPSPSLPPPNKRSKSPTMTEAADALSPPPPSPSSSMGSFYKQHRVLSPRPVPDLTEVKPRKSPSMLGPGGSEPPPRRRSSLSGDTVPKSLATLDGSRRLELGLLKDSELSSQGSRQPWTPVPESPRPPPSSAASPAPPFVNSPDFGALDWTVPESPRGPRRTSFPGFAVAAETPKTPGAKPRGHRHSSSGGVKAKEIDPPEKPVGALVNAQHVERKEPPEEGRDSEPQEGLGLLEPGKSMLSGEPKPAEARSWTAQRPALRITGVGHPKFDDAPASPVGPLPGSEILSPGESEETKSLDTELLPPTAKKPGLLSEEGDLCASTDSPMEVDRRQSRGTLLGRSGGEETAGGPRLFEAPLFQEVEMFDTDDLHSESAYVLLVGPDGNSKGTSDLEGGEVFVWLGADYLKQGEDRRASSGSAMSTDSGDREEGLKDGKGLGDEFVRRRGLPSRAPIMVRRYHLSVLFFSLRMGSGGPWGSLQAAAFVGQIAFILIWFADAHRVSVYLSSFQAFKCLP
jgi:hypothetical protein